MTTSDTDREAEEAEINRLIARFRDGHIFYDPYFGVRWEFYRDLPNGGMIIGKTWRKGHGQRQAFTWDADKVRFEFSLFLTGWTERERKEALDKEALERERVYIIEPGAELADALEDLSKMEDRLENLRADTSRQYPKAEISNLQKQMKAQKALISKLQGTELADALEDLNKMEDWLENLRAYTGRYPPKAAISNLQKQMKAQKALISKLQERRMTGQAAAEEYRRRWSDQPEFDAHMIALFDAELIEMDSRTGLLYPTKLGMLVQRIID